MPRKSTNSNIDGEKERIFIHRGRPRLTGSQPFWAGKEDYYTSIVMDRSQYADIVRTAAERHCTVKEMMYRLVEASAAFDKEVYEGLLRRVAVTGESVGAVLKGVLQKALKEEEKDV